MTESRHADAASNPRNAHPDSNWTKLCDAEDAALAERWKHAYPDHERTPTTPRIGLALSGGGIRSATFCIGLIRGLAQNGILRRFDYLSTVSGGGFAGSVLGRLVTTLGIDRAEETLAAGDSVVLTWLRRYGRYLTPAGARDFGMLIATYLRSAVAVHFEIGLLAVLIGLLVAAPHAILPRLVGLDETSWHGWRTFWWPLAVAAWLAIAPALMIAYWNVRSKLDEASDASVGKAFAWTSLLILLAITAAVLAWAIRSSIDYFRLEVHPLPPLAPLLAISGAGVLLVLLWLVFSALTNYQRVVSEFVAEQRNRLTRALRFINKLVLALMCFGVLDFVCFRVLEMATRRLPEDGTGGWLIGGLGSGALFAILLRAFAEPLQKLANAPDNSAARWMPRLINFAGLGVGLLVVGTWALLVQWLVFDENSWSLLNDLTAVQRIVVLFVVIATWFVLTSGNRDTVNASSLHSFYRARLIRAYLSVGNRQRFDHGTLESLRGSNAIEGMTSVTDVMRGDDVALRDYQPEASGGPIHLVCACINQTIDDASKLFNADRKGAAIVASSRGIEVGLEDPVLARDDIRLGSLGHWVATSGAAAAPGAGSNTTSGWALLLFLVGARLGFWLDSLTIGAKKPNSKGTPATLRETKSGLLMTEALAWFGGRARRWWFLSDGGHFDNTGVYALLRRQLDCIVLADCGADAKFEFADLENLIRKARIDFDTDIEFYTRREVEGLFPSGDAHLQVLALEEMKDNASVRGVLLARICYHSSDPTRRKLGSLLVVKPNLHEALDRDLLAYAERNPSFPQQATGDQFFDEAQWESYHRLGYDFGRAMTSPWLRHVPGWRIAVECPMPLLPLRKVALAAVTGTSDALPFWRRSVAATALGTGIGLGALGTVLLSGWQVIESVQTRQRTEMTQATANEKEAFGNLQDIEAEVERASIAVDSCRRDPTTANVDCSDPSSFDLDRINGEKLRQIYETSIGLAGTKRNDAITSLIARVQYACGAKEDICGTGVGLAPTLCTRTCEPPRDPSIYWSQPPLADDWNRNPVVAWTMGVAQSLLGADFTEHDQLASNDGVDALPSAPESTSIDAEVSEPVAVAPSFDSVPAIVAPVATQLPAPPPAPPTASAPEASPPSDGSAQSVRDQQAINNAQQSANATNLDRYTQQIQEDRPGSAAQVTTAAKAPPVQGPTATGAAPEVGAETQPFPECSLAGKPVTIYVQIFDESLRPGFERLGQQLLGPDSRNHNVVVAGIENVVATALRRGTAPPRGYRTPTMIVHSDGDKNCAAALGSTLQPKFNAIYGGTDDGYISVRSLPESLASPTPRHVIELWLPTPSNLAR